MFLIPSLALHLTSSLLFHNQKFLVFRTKRAQQVGSPLPSSLDPCTPTKSGLRTGSKVTSDVQTPCPEPSKVTFSLELDLLAELYYTCMSGKRTEDGANVKQWRKKCQLNVFFYDTS